MAVGSAKENVAAAQLWLTNAEKAYDSDAEVFADMNLLLAESEIRRLREKNKKNKRKILSKMSFCIIIIIVLFFCIDGKIFMSGSDMMAASVLPERILEKSAVTAEPVEKRGESYNIKNGLSSEASNEKAFEVSAVSEIVVKEAEARVEKPVEKAKKTVESVKNNEAKVNELSKVAEKALRGL